jgi:hypothetical protein
VECRGHRQLLGRQRQRQKRERKTTGRRRTSSCRQRFGHISKRRIFVGGNSRSRKRRFQAEKFGSWQKNNKSFKSTLQVRHFLITTENKI